LSTKDIRSARHGKTKVNIRRLCFNEPSFTREKYTYTPTHNAAHSQSLFVKLQPTTCKRRVIASTFNYD